MATINYTSVSVASGFLKVEWSGLSSGDDGQPFDCNGLEIASFHAFGTFSGNVTLQGSNEITPSDFADMVSVGTPRLEPLGNAAHFVGSVRPNFASGGSGTLNMALFLIERS